MSEVVARLFERLSRRLIPTAERFRRGPASPSQIPAVGGYFESPRPVVAFGPGCLVEQGGEHRTLFQPCVRTEFERWERSRNRMRRRRRREAWLAARGVGEVD
jgi:hypothetical protein